MSAAVARERQASPPATQATVMCVVDQRSLDGDALGVAVRMARRHGAAVHLVSAAPAHRRAPRLPRSGREPAMEVCSRRSSLDVGGRAARRMLAHATAVIPAEMAVSCEARGGDAVRAIVEAIGLVRPLVIVLSADPGGAGPEGMRRVLAGAAAAGSAVVVA